MKAHSVVYWLAQVGLLVLLAMSVAGMVRYDGGTPLERVLQTLVGIAVWSFLIWRVKTQPRRWGLRVGIFLIGVLAFQTYFWRRGVTGPAPVPVDMDPSLFAYVVYELPLVITAICCILLRWQYPEDEVQPDASR
jgi:hypothetical protein